MKNLTRILSSFSLIVVMVFSARSQDVFKVAPVGIGTINPAQALDVTGNVKFSGALMPGASSGASGNMLLSSGAGVTPLWLANGTSGNILSSNGGGVPTWISSNSIVWALTGNIISATYGTNFLGTTNTQPFEFFANNKYSGVFDATNSNIYLGSGGSTAKATGNESSTIVTGAIGNVGIGDGAIGTAANGTSYNVAIGPVSLSNYAGAIVGNVAIGYQAENNITSGGPNTAFGYSALNNAAGAGGANNLAIGFKAGFTHSTGSTNVAVGDSALYTGSNGSGNTALGTSALKVLTTGTNNTALGRNAGNGVTAGTGTVSIGWDTKTATTGYGSVAIGSAALLANTFSQKVAVGAGAMKNDNLSSLGVTTVAIGDSAFGSSGGTEQDVALGAYALKSFVTSGQCQESAIGYGSMLNATGFTTNSQAYMIATGYKTLYNYTSMGSGPTPIGAYALYGANGGGSTLGIYNTPIGFAALASVTTGADNVAIGSSIMTTTLAAALTTAPLGLLSTGSSNVAIGYNAASFTNGGSNVAIGINTSVGGNSTTVGTGGSNTAVGISASAGSTTTAAVGSADNTALGYSASAGNNTVTTDFATAIGALATAAPATGTTAATSATALGTSASATANNSTAIGANAVANTTNTLILGGTGVNAVSVGIGTNTPKQELEVAPAITTVNLIGVEHGNTFSAATSATTDQVLFAKVNGDIYSIPNGSNGQTLTLTSGIPTWTSPSSYTATLPLTVTGSNLLLSGAYGGVLYGTGTGSAFTAPGNTLNILTEDPISGFPQFDTIIPSSLSSHDEWGNQAVVTDSSNNPGGPENTVTGNGLAAYPLRLSHQGAAIGQVLAWFHGTGYGTWKPSSGNASLVTNNIVPAGGSAITVANGTGQVVGGSNVILDIQGTSGGLLSGNGSGSSATFTAGGTNGYVYTYTGAGASSWQPVTVPLPWSLTGNSSTVPGTNFIGTTDDEQFRFGVNDNYVNTFYYAGSIDPQTVIVGGVPTTFANTYLGAAGPNNEIGGAGGNDGGTFNVAFGEGALAGETLGGYAANSGTNNVALGALCNLINTTGSNDVSLGCTAMRYNNVGNGEVAVGLGTLCSVTSVAGTNNNTAIGSESMQGGASCANGPCGSNYYGSYNTASGYFSLYSLSGAAAASNTAIGTYAAYNTIASRNTGLGDSALYTNTTGANNTVLGYGANVASGALTNAIAIGYMASATASNSITLGNSSAGSLYIPGYNTVGSLYYTSAGSGLVLPLTPSSTSGYLLQSNGAGIAPAWNSVTPTSGTVTNVTGTSPIVVTGTWNINLQGLNTNEGGVLYSTGTGNSALFTGTGTTGQVLISNGTGAPMWGTPTSSAWNLTGNAAVAGNFVGTTTDLPLVFDVNTSDAGGAEGGGYALYVDPQTGGNSNTYAGGWSLNNSADGAGHGDAGTYNVALGNAALGNNNTGGNYNVAIGYESNISANGANTTSSYTVSIGAFTLLRDINGTGETTIGYNALRFLQNVSSPPATSTDWDNTAMGFQSMYGVGGGGSNSYGAYNTALGYEALYSNTTSGRASNTAMGTYAAFNTTASKNTAVGDSALYTNTSGATNAALGYAANVNVGTLTNATVVGYRALAYHSNSVILGDTIAGSLVNVGIGTGAPATDAGICIKNLHLETRNGASAPTVATSSGPGNSAVLISGVGSTDVAGGVSLNIGSGVTSVPQEITVTFNMPYKTAPTVVLAPVNTAAAAAMTTDQVYVSSTTTSFTVDFNNVPASGTYNFNYFVLETQ